MGMLTPAIWKKNSWPETTGKKEKEKPAKEVETPARSAKEERAKREIPKGHFGKSFAACARKCSLPTRSLQKES